MRFKVGDEVRFLNETGEGEITRIEGGKLFVDIDGFEYPYSPADVILVDGENTVFETRDFGSDREEKNIHESTENHAETPINIALKGALSQVFERVNPKGIPECDLHIEKLVKKHEHLTNGEIVSLQLEYFKHILDSAEREKVRELIVIHGVGEGVLKTEVRQYLSSFAHITYEDASFQRYGRGATYVRLYGL